MTKKSLLLIALVALVVAACVVGPCACRRSRLRRHARMLPQDKAGEHERALLAEGPAAVPALIHVVRTGNRYQVHTASHLLADIGDPRAIEPLLDAFRRDAQHQHERYPTLLASSLARFREAAAPAILARLAAGQAELAPLAGGVCGEAAVAHLTRLANVRGKPDRYYQLIVRALGDTQSPTAIDPILEFIERPNVAGLVRAALLCIGEAGGPRYVGLLGGTDSPRVRQLMAEIAGELQLGDAVPALVGILKAPGTRWDGIGGVALKALANVPQNGQAALFFEIMQRLEADPKDSYYAALAAVGLGNEGDRRAARLLRRHIDACIQGQGVWPPQAFRALARSRASGSVGLLCGLLDRFRRDDSTRGEGMVSACLDALGYSGSPKAARAVLGWLEAQPEATQGLGRHGTVRRSVQNAIRSLGELRAEKALPVLAKLRDAKLHSACGGGHALPFHDVAAEAIRKIAEAAENGGRSTPR